MRNGSSDHVVGVIISVVPRVVLAVLSAFFFIIATPAYSQSSGLVAAYGFNEGSGTSVMDFSGNGNLGTLTDTTWSTAGKYGGALSFNGTSSWVIIANSASLNLTAGMTLEAWVNASATGSVWRTVALKEQTAGLIYALYANTDTNRPSGHVYIASESDIRGSAAVALNVWTHLAATYDGATLRLFVNAIQVSSKAVAGNMKTSTGALRIGGNSIWGEYFKGLIDEVRIYNRPLSASEIQTDMNTPVGGAPPPSDTTSPAVSMTAPANGATLSGIVSLSADASDNVAVAGVQFLVNNTPVGVEDVAAPYAVNWDTSTVANGSGYQITARARDAAGNQSTSAAVVVSVNNSAPPPASGLVAAYGFNEGAGTSVTDISGNANSGTVTNAAWSPNGKFGGALSFDGTSSWVTIADSASLHLTTGMTLEAWVNPSATGSMWRNVVLKEQSGGLIYALYANTDSNRPSGHVYVASEFYTQGTAAVPLNTWTHLATSYDGTTLRVFVNGALTNSLVAGGNIKTSTGVLRIGGDSIWGEYFRGFIDEVRVYNRPLSATEIQTDMNTPVGGTPPPPDTIPPTVSMSAPADGSTQSGTVTLNANASDNVGISGVQFLVNGSAVGNEDSAAPYSASWDTTMVTNGSYNITARARDAAGNQATSAAVTVNVSNTPDATPPSVTVTAPVDGATISGTATLGANASDNIGIIGVQFFVNGGAVGAEDTAAPYAVSWNTTAVANGSYTITARARDAAGNATTSLPISVSVSNTAPPPQPGLVAAYAFNEGNGTVVTDVSGNGNNGTINNAAWNSAGKYGWTLSFNGNTSRINIPDASSLHLTTGMTLEAWVKPTTLSGWNAILIKEKTGGLVYGLYANSDTNRPSGHIYISVETDTRGTAQLGLNSWTHLATTYDGNLLTLYVNGVQASSRSLGGNTLTSTGSLSIGSDLFAGESFTGMIDEVRIYNRALSAAEIQTDVNTAVATTPIVDKGPPSVSVLAPAQGSTISGLSTLYASASDDVNVAGVQFYVNGSPLGAELTAAPFTMTWNTATGSNGPHVITAVARDGVGNRTTSAAEDVIVDNTNDPALVGSWTAPFDWPIVAINMVVTRDGNVLSWDGPPSNGGSSALLWSPTTGNFTSVPNNVTNMFCNAAVALPDGRILAFGGHADWGIGVRNADIFDPVTKLWKPVASMHYARWYPTATVLPDGRVLSVSGSTTCETCIASIPEIYNPALNTWTALPSASWAVNLYPLMFVLPDGRVLEAGVTRQATETRVLDLNTNTWTTVDPIPRDGHSAVMYDLGKIMKSGSSSDVGANTAPSESTTFTLDMTQPAPAWQQSPNMAYPRAFHNLTLLPDGSVLTTAGGATKDGEDYSNAVLPAELWSPATKTWSTMAAQHDGRLYHGTAVLLLDGRVLIAGSGRAGTDPIFTGEIYSPPYLFKGSRPTISSTPASAGYASTFFIGSPDAASVSSVTLLKISAATHAFNMEQRILRLNFTQAAGGLNVTAPANSNLAPPGYYVMYILNGAGVPSKGAVVQIH